MPYRLNAETGQEEIGANEAWWPVEYDKVLPFFSPDGSAHACWIGPWGKPFFRCIILPGMAGLGPAARVCQHRAGLSSAGPKGLQPTLRPSVRSPASPAGARPSGQRPPRARTVWANLCVSKDWRKA